MLFFLIYRFKHISVFIMELINYTPTVVCVGTFDSTLDSHRKYFDKPPEAPSHSFKNITI